MNRSGLTPFGAICLFAFAVLCFSACQGCTAVPSAPTDRQQFVAHAAENILSVGLVPVLSNNPDYVTAAQTIAGALGSFSGATITPEGVAAFVAKTNLRADEQKTVTALVMAAWGVYARDYAQQVGANVRPDVKLFLNAVSNGILNAAAAVPKWDNGSALHNEPITRTIIGI